MTVDTAVGISFHSRVDVDSLSALSNLLCGSSAVIVIGVVSKLGLCIFF